MKIDVYIVYKSSLILLLFILFDFFSSFEGKVSWGRMGMLNECHKPFETAGSKKLTFPCNR